MVGIIIESYAVFVAIAMALYLPQVMLYIFQNSRVIFVRLVYFVAAFYAWMMAVADGPFYVDNLHYEIASIIQQIHYI